MSRPKGTPKTGGRQPGSPNKQTLDVKELAKDYTEDAVRTLASIMTNREEAAPARVAAARELLDRAHGKPKQSVDVDANVKASITEVRRTLVDPRHSDA
jgi:hypothetical protein